MIEPLISIIIPTRNRARHLDIAIESMLAQTYKNTEVIIVDDNSTDNTAEVARAYAAKYPNIRYEKLPGDDPDRLAPNGTDINAGWQARNYGMSLANGDFITFQDDDDGSCSNRIEFQYEMLKKYNVWHVTIDWQQYRDELNCKRLDLQITDKNITSTAEILALAKKTKPKLFKHPYPRGGAKNILEKILRRIDTKYLTSQAPYPGYAAGMPLFKREVMAKCHFRQAYERTRPSLRGRGADRDFNFWVAETFKNSLAIKTPLHLWRVKTQNLAYADEKYRPK